MSQHHNINIIGAALGWGAKLHETELGPDVFHGAELAVTLSSFTDKNWQWHKTLYPSLRHNNHITLDYSQRIKQVAEFNQQLAQEVRQQAEEGRSYVVLGGDHAIAIGTWSGTISALNAKQQFGLLWIDAHMDSHTPDTTPSHALHGMPLAVLLGYGEPILVNLMAPGAKLSPEHVVIFGVRSFESGEAALLASLKVRIYFMEEIRDRGVETCMQEAIQIVSQAPKGFGLSIDLDAFDPIEAPGVGSPEPNGIFADGLVPELKKAFSHPLFKTVEIVEYNPTRDKDKKTIKLTQRILGLL